MTRFWLGLWAALLAGAAACGDSTGLPPAQFFNEVDTTTIYALTGTPIATPSAYDIVSRQLVRIDLAQAFDFAIDITADGAARVYPAGALKLFPEAGVLLMSQQFDEVSRAPEDDPYVQDSSVVVTVGTVFVARSRATQDLCNIFSVLPRYGKFHVLAIDADSARTVTLELLVNQNCGYRGLEPGVPRN